MLHRRHDTVIIDVRSPGEFAAARIPGAVNLPLFSDTERSEIGTLYKQVGQDAAVSRSYALVNPRKEALVKHAKQLSKGQPMCTAGAVASGHNCCDLIKR